MIDLMFNSMLLMLIPLLMYKLWIEVLSTQGQSMAGSVVPFAFLHLCIFTYRIG